MDFEQLMQIGTALLGWSAGGILALFAARKMYDVMTPFDVQKELVEDKNLAVGASKSLYMVAVGIIIHGLMSGDKLSPDLMTEILYCVILLVVSFMLLALGRWILVKASSFDFDHEIHETQNTALGFVEGGWYVALAVIIHSAL